jgi:hypothetical protein
MSMRRVRRAERRGLRGLRAANRRSGCGTFTAPATPALELAAAASPRLIAADRLAQPETEGGPQVDRDDDAGRGDLLPAQATGGKLAPPATAPPHSPASDDESVRLAPLFIVLLSFVLLALLASWSLLRRRSAAVRQEAVVRPLFPPPPWAEEPPASEPEPEQTPDIEAAVPQEQVGPRDGGEIPEQPPEATRRYTRRTGGLLGPRASSLILGLAERLRRRR